MAFPCPLFRLTTGQTKMFVEKGNPLQWTIKSLLQAINFQLLNILNPKHNNRFIPETALRSVNESEFCDQPRSIGAIVLNDN